MATQLKLVNASIGKRLGSKVIDVLPVLLVWVICASVAVGALGSAAGTGTDGSGASAGQAASALAGFGIWTGVGSLLLVAYGIWLWGWEATTGKTPGNALLGLRTTGETGLLPGWGAIFVRGLIVGVAGLVPLVGPVIVLVSARWDHNGQRQGWHDKVARTLVCDVRAGRNPLTTGGLHGPQSFAPDVGQASPSVPSGADLSEGAWPGGFPPGAVPTAAVPTGAVPTGAVATAAVPTGALPTAGPAGSGAVLVAGAAGPQSPVHPDEAFEQTRISGAGAPAASASATFDDGTTVPLKAEALLGRNPSAASGEYVNQLIDFADLGRSVSKTHLHLRADGHGVWVTDRNSTNGSAVTSPDGVRTPLTPGRPVLAVSGSTVHFGDRHFVVGRA